MAADRSKAKRKKSFLVIGLGTFGYQTAAALYEGGANVLAVDQQQSLVDSIAGSVTRAICADATNEDVLRTIGAFEVDAAIVAIRNDFETSVLITHTLRLGDVEDIYVQVGSRRQASAILALGAKKVIFPERDMADRLAAQLLFSNLADLLPLGENFGIIEVTLPHALNGQSLIQLDLRGRHGINVIAVKHESPGKSRPQGFNLSIGPSEPIHEGDVLVVLGTMSRLSAFRAWIHETEEKEIIEG